MFLTEHSGDHKNRPYMLMLRTISTKYYGAMLDGW